MEYYVGTSGWMYDWNPDGFDWYIKYSRLNAVELNASFYRFPYPNQVRAWARKSMPKGIRWSIKVHRSITHVHLLNERAIDLFRKFIKLFEPLGNLIDFYLLQLPPRVRPKDVIIGRIERFVKEFNLGWKLAVEWRHNEWFNEYWVKWARSLELTVVSVDAPEFRFYARSGPYTYLRLHGRTFWYSHYYSDEELNEIAQKVLKLGGDKIYVFFNNDHDMLENAQRMLKTLLRLKSL
ncbi:MAG: DUF72 domain-containing protein [Thermoprotei archaeon]|nr:MAG: DUF72 domain-containing protein [Thermoprotei archaeon]